MKLSGITEVLPTYRSLLVFYDNKRMTYHKLERILNRLKQKKSTKTETKKMPIELACQILLCKRFRRHV